MRSIRKYAVMLAILLPTFCPGQAVFNYTETIGVEEGLSSNLINDVFQDNRGFLWIATTYGLNRYDGNKIVSYLKEEKPASLPDNSIYSILQKDDDHLMMGTDQGIAIMNLVNFSFQTIHLKTDNLHTTFENQILLLKRDFQKNIWATTPTVIYRLDSNFHILNVFHTQYNSEKYRRRNVLRIIPLPTNEVLFWLYNGIYIWSSANGKLDTIKALNHSKYSFLAGSLDKKVAFLNDKYLVLMLKNQFIIYDVVNKEIYQRNIPTDSHFRLLNICSYWRNKMAISTDQKGAVIYALNFKDGQPVLEKKSDWFLKTQFLSSIFCDKEKNYWIGAGSVGLTKVPADKQLFVNKELFDFAKNRNSTSEITEFFPVKNEILIGTYGSGYYQYNPQTGNLKQHSVNLSRSSENMVWNFRQMTEDTIWIGTQQGLIWCCLKNHSIGRLSIPHPTVLDSVPIPTLFEDSKSRIWIGLGMGNGLAIYEKKKKKFHLYSYQSGSYPYRYPKNMAEDAKGNIWLTSDATSNLVKWNHMTGQFEKIVIRSLNGEIHFETGGFYLDRFKNEIWFGIRSIGLINYRIDDNKTTIYGLEQGLSLAGMIKSIFQDKRGRLWLGTTEGISCFDPANSHITNYTRTDGLKAPFYSSSFYFNQQEQTIYAGGPGIMTQFKIPKKEKKSEPLKIILTGLLINGRDTSLPLKESLLLGPKQNNLVIQFSSVNLSNGNENTYQYRLNETEWLDLGKQTEIRFSSLNPGDYSLELRAARKGESFSPSQKILDFTISPPFTATIWFYLLCFAVAVAMIYHRYRNRLQHFKNLATMRSRISRDLHDEIGSKVTNINMMSQILEQKPAKERGNNLLKKIQEESEEITQSIREIIWNIDPDNDSLELAMPRMLSFASGLLESKNITVHANIFGMQSVELNMEQRRDFFLIYKEAIHNIVKHSNATDVEIHSSIKNKLFVMQVSDNGDGYDVNNPKDKSGLRYMKQRAEKNHWNLEIKSEINQGTTVSILIKIAKGKSFLSIT